MKNQAHVLEVVLQNATVRMAVTGTVLSCSVAQPGPGRNIPVILLDGKPWLVNMTLGPGGPPENASSTS